ncbi:hypothetical protein BC833DRAFT_568788 [Globomyces pollinis-pini]|nr:hypothetical protein BC833DRAFT_568788 [Globomyces pollinis-pini]
MSKQPNLLQLSGAMLFAGIGFSISLNTLLQYGVSFKYQNDNGRQKLLNLLCFVCIISMIPYYYTNQSKEFHWLNDATLLIGDIGIQYGLVVLTHNSIVKLKVYYEKSAIIKHLHNCVYAMYFLPPLPLALIVLSIMDGLEKGTLARSSIYNTKYYKPFVIVAISLVNLFSFTADLLLLYKVLHLKTSLSNSKPASKEIKSCDIGPTTIGKRSSTVGTTPGKRSSIAGPTPKGRPSSSVGPAQKGEVGPTPIGNLSTITNSDKNQPATISMNTIYILVILLIIIDMISKILVILDYPAFDSIVTLTSLALRSLANLKFGMKLKSHFSNQLSTDDKPTRKPTNTNTNVNVFQTMKTNQQSLMTANDRISRPQRKD